METSKTIQQALSTGNANLVRELARTSQTSQQEMAYEFIADLIENRHPHGQPHRAPYTEDRSSAA